MSLSNDKSPKDVVSTYQVILEIASYLKELISDPKALDKAIKDAYCLTEIEKNKSNEAKDSISKYEILIQEQAKNAQDLVNERSSLDKKKSEIDKSKGDLDKVVAEIKKLDDDLKIKQRKVSADLKELQDQRITLAQDRVCLDKKAHEVADRSKSIESYEASLRLRAEQLKVITEGL